MGVSTKDIAAVCGVSRGTVDRALNNRGSINPVTRQKILEAAGSLDYKPHYIASSLAKGKTMTIGIIVFDLNNRFFTQFINSLESRANELGYFIYLTLTDKRVEKEAQCIEQLVSRHVDGIVLCSVNGDNSYPQYLSNLNVPIVTITNKVSDKLSFLGIDDRKAMKDAVKFIINRNYENIVYISPVLSMRGQRNIYAQEQRCSGYLEAMNEAGSNFEPNIIQSYNYTKIISSMKFDKKHRTAILCSSDIHALEVMNTLKDLGIKAPEDVGLMGFDNIDTLDYVFPGLTTVAYPTNLIGVEAINQLVSKIEGKELTEDIFFHHKIIMRETI